MVMMKSMKTKAQKEAPHFHLFVTIKVQSVLNTLQYKEIISLTKTLKIKSHIIWLQG
jgi:hypothetical protein